MVTAFGSAEDLFAGHPFGCPEGSLGVHPSGGPKRLFGVHLLGCPELRSRAPTRNGIARAQAGSRGLCARTPAASPRTFAPAAHLVFETPSHCESPRRAARAIAGAPGAFAGR